MRVQKALGQYLAQQLPGFNPASLHVAKFSHGQSNPTYFIRVSFNKRNSLITRVASHNTRYFLPN